MTWNWLSLYKNNKTEAEVLGLAAIAIESLFVKLQGRAPSQQYEDGYADGIAAAAKLLREMIK